MSNIHIYFNSKQLFLWNTFLFFFCVLDCSRNVDAVFKSRGKTLFALARMKYWGPFDRGLVILSKMFPWKLKTLINKICRTCCITFNQILSVVKFYTAIFWFEALYTKPVRSHVYIFLKFVIIYFKEENFWFLWIYVYVM